MTKLQTLWEKYDQMYFYKYIMCPYEFPLRIRTNTQEIEIRSSDWEYVCCTSNPRKEKSVIKAMTPNICTT